MPAQETLLRYVKMAGEDKQRYYREKDAMLKEQRREQRRLQQ